MVQVYRSNKLLETENESQRTPVRLCFYRNNITNVAWKVYTSLLVSQPSVCISSCFCLFFHNWLKHLFFKPHNMVIVFKFPNGKCNFGDTKNLKLRSGESCEGSHVKTKRERDQSHTGSVALSGYENMTEINLLQAQVPSQKSTRALKMH